MAEFLTKCTWDRYVALERLEFDRMWVGVSESEHASQMCLIVSNLINYTFNSLLLFFTSILLRLVLTFGLGWWFIYH